MAFDSPKDMINYTATATFDLGSPFIEDMLLEDIPRGQWVLIISNMLMFSNDLDLFVLSLTRIFP